MEKNKNNIINKSKRSTKVIIVDKFEDNPQLEGKEMQFHKKPGPIKPPGPKKPTLRELIIGLSNRIDKVEDILERNNLRLEKIEDILKKNNLH